MSSIGYITGTFDLLHADHLRLLRNAKQYCTVLIVGLVTDELAVKQKRQTFFNFEHRRVLLENCKNVDIVVAHNGESKPQAYRKLKFNVLITSDEYMNSDEHTLFEHECGGDVKTIYIPKGNTTSSTNIIGKIVDRLESERAIVAMSISGAMTRVGPAGSRKLVKQIRFGELERGANTRDNYGICDSNGHVKRNFSFTLPEYLVKRKQVYGDVYPMISGVNGNRELLMNQMFQKRQWSTYISNNVVYVEDDKKNGGDDVVFERRSPACVTHMLQKYVEGSVTLRQFIINEDNADVVDSVIRRVLEIIKEIHDSDVVHGDMHPRNILVDGSGDVKIVDFGWVLHSSFDMTHAEQELYMDMLVGNFDLYMFTQTLKIECGLCI
jgi:glycerol-3-phosphate cytidylyltransferase